MIIQTFSSLNFMCTGKLTIFKFYCQYFSSIFFFLQSLILCMSVKISKTLFIRLLSTTGFCMIKNFLSIEANKRWKGFTTLPYYYYYFIVFLFIIKLLACCWNYIYIYVTYWVLSLWHTEWGVYFESTSLFTCL